MLIGDGALLDDGLLDSMLASVEPAAVLPVAAGEPTVLSVEAVRSELPGGTDCLVAIGGGSTLDTAKLVAGMVSSDRPLYEHLLGRMPFAAPLPLVAVPTTAGSGAEVTRTAVVSTGTRKSWAWDDALRPATAVLDPGLTLELPAAITVATGLDAFVHALEAATAQNRHDEAEAAARWAFNEISEALPTVLATPEDLHGRRRMLVAACAAGAGIDRCGTGLGHAIGHALGSLAKVPHGLSVMLGTLVSVEWNSEGAPARFADLAPDVPGEVRRLAERVGFERLLAPVASGQTIDPATLAAELVREEHRPMRINSAVPAPESDVPWLAAAVAQEWNRIGALT